jgi:uncharacterized membrane protein YphA (DoxX/SURF4 family)
MFAKMNQFQVGFASFILRWGLAAICVVHGVIKIHQSAPLGPEMSLTVQRFVGWGELLCGLALAVGLLSRVAALGIIVVQVGAIFLVTGHYALMVAPMGKVGADYRKVGPEFNLVLIAMCLSVLVLGSGVFSLDHLFVTLWRRWRASTAARTVAVQNKPQATPEPLAIATHSVPEPVVVPTVPG